MQHFQHRPLQCLRALAQRRPAVRAFASCAALRKVFVEGDVVLLKDKADNSREGTLTTLRAGKTTNSHRGVLQHSDIIGKQPRQVVRTKKGSSFRVHEPTLAEYVCLTPRIVTPLYPSDTNLIVSLLDIHVDTPSGTGREPPLEILEAGTGHGSLTLHLSRAIHAGNRPLPNVSATALTETNSEDAIYNGETVSDLEEASLEAWKTSRRAIVHTLDISAKHSKHARKIVKGFRHGMYARNVEFHVGDVSEWISSQKVLRQTDEPFLSHVFLDLPNADSHIANVAPALHVDGLLAVFNPSITQIADCVKVIREQRLPYLLDQVVELGAGNIRKWDVKSVQPRATLKAKAPSSSETSDEEPSTPLGETGSEDEAVASQKARDSELAEALAKKEQDKDWVMVCRPKPGERVVGGGFLALWRRMEPAPVLEAEPEAEAEPKPEAEPKSDADSTARSNSNNSPS